MLQHNTRQEIAAETRRKLLAAAKSLFAKNGYKGTTVRSINRKINMGDGLIYHYFPGGKKEIFTVIVRENIEQSIDKMNSYNEKMEHLPLEEVLKKILILAENGFAENLELLKILIKEGSAIDFSKIQNIQRLLKTIKNRREWLVSFLKRRYEKGEIKKMDFDIAADQLMAISINNLFGDIINLEIAILPNSQKKERIVEHILNTWKKP